jgi:hypothetical protein
LKGIFMKSVLLAVVGFGMSLSPLYAADPVVLTSGGSITISCAGGATVAPPAAPAISPQLLSRLSASPQSCPSVTLQGVAGGTFYESRCVDQAIKLINAGFAEFGRFSPDFKCSAFRGWIERISDSSTTQVNSRSGYSGECLSNWIQQAQQSLF